MMIICLRFSSRVKWCVWKNERFWCRCREVTTGGKCYELWSAFVRHEKCLEMVNTPSHDPEDRAC